MKERLKRGWSLEYPEFGNLGIRGTSLTLLTGLEELIEPIDVITGHHRTHMTGYIFRLHSIVCDRSSCSIIHFIAYHISTLVTLSSMWGWEEGGVADVDGCSGSM